MKSTIGAFRGAYAQEWVWWPAQLQAAALSGVAAVVVMLWCTVRLYPWWQDWQQGTEQLRVLQQQALAAGPWVASAPTPAVCSDPAPCLAQITMLATAQGLSVAAAETDPLPAQAGLRVSLDLRLAQATEGEARFWQFLRTLTTLPFSLDVRMWSQQLQPSGQAYPAADDWAWQARVIFHVVAHKPQQRTQLAALALGPNVLALRPVREPTPAASLAASATILNAQHWQWLGWVQWDHAQHVLLRYRTPKGSIQVLLPAKAQHYTVVESVPVRVVATKEQQLRLEFAGLGTLDLGLAP